MTEGLVVETFQTMFRKMFFVNGCDVVARWTWWRATG